METKSLIYQKLEAFIKKYYTNELLKGVILFVGFGLLYFFFTLFVEYFLWLKPTGRTILFWTFVGVELFLLSRFILFPLFKLFKLQKGIDYKQASQIIGNHFSEVNDKLINFLQLAENNKPSELLLASIDQKGKTLQPIPFGNAINFKKNTKYLPWAIIPLLFLAFFMLTGNSDIIADSMNRVVRYNEKFSPPAPFSFVVLNDNLQTEQGSDFILQVKSEGKVVPENAMIIIGDESYYMESTKPGVFEYRFTKPSKNITFHVESNSVSTPDLELSVVAVPTISNFEMVLQFPSYLNRKAETIKGSGNAIVPEGTKVSWKVSALATNQIQYFEGSAYSSFIEKDNLFSFAKTILQNTEYQILTSNSKVKHYEKLNYQITTIKDQFPTISVNNAPDSLRVQKNILIGQVSDDNGLHKLQIVYYPKNNERAALKSTIPVKKELFDQFVFSFPGNLPITEGVAYEYYFEVFDNDALHNFKSTKSSIFSDRINTEEERQEEQLKQQKDNINSLEKSLKNQEKQLSEMDKLQKMSKEKEILEFKDKQKINDFIKRQKQQEEMMKEFSKELKNNLNEFNKNDKDQKKEQLEKRAENIEKQTDENQKLLDELQKLTEKIQDLDVQEKLDKIKQNSKNQAKNLEQLVELTKKYYVEKKAEQLTKKLDKLAEKQENLSKEDKENTSAKQEELNKEFDKLQEELRELEKDNKELKKPLDIPSDEKQEKSIEEDMEKASDELQKDQKEKAKPKQKSAAQKMKQMSQKMSDSMASGQMEQMDEDIKAMRQILDNLLAFSFSQENLMKQFKGLKKGAPSYNKFLKNQQDLKQQFKHVDDSLFAMSLRNEMITEKVTEEIGKVHYNVDKSLETLAEAMIPKGVSHQQYTVSAANRLADFLSDIMNSMQMSMSGMGSGAGKPKPGQGQGGGQLPDIIQKQKGLSDKMKEGIEKGDKPGDGKEGEKGDKPGGKEGEKGEKGEKGKGNQKGNKPGEGSGGGQGNNDGEENARELMEIFQEQRRLRQQLEDQLRKQGLTPGGQKVLDQMKDAEKQILNKGFKNEVLQRMLNINYEMLKLEKAVQQQGEDSKRQSETNQKEFNNKVKPLSPEMQQYLNSVEILNRQSLPLRPNFNQKVQEYFKTND
ncbi:glutamyl-tRNA synthetase [Flavobacterium filum]|uniref:glutamyl-tRNA synthetase n=1 Tax=Flavobacterium filum TaxID=370974 RepID=UPI00042642E1|nr:glutamyl-tRNA synthetase [Flavobacterium filum]